MSESDHTTTETDSGGEPAATGRRVDRVRTYLWWGVLGGLVLLGGIAAVQFYANASRAIAVWVAPDFEPVFQAVFNLVVLLCAIAGAAVALRELSN